MEDLRAQWRASPLALRALMTAYLLLGAWGGLAGAHALTSAHGNWITWSVALLILEPVGGTSLAALVFLYWPNSWVGGLLGEALGRAKAAVLLIAACVLGWLASVLIYAASELWKLR